MEQMFDLKYHGNLTLHEQNNMTAEERRWWMKRLQKQRDKEAEQSKASSGPRSPRMPSI